MNLMDDLDLIEQNAKRLLKEMPPGVTLLAAAKTRSVEEVRAAYEAGIRYFGHNYVQEARMMLEKVDFKAKWHLIGHLQRNKAKDAVGLFDMVETLDSVRLAEELEKRCAAAGKKVEVLIEINSGAEEDKAGVLPQDLETLVEAVAELQHIQVVGLMTMGPLTGEARESRPYFVKTRQLFEVLKRSNLPGVEMRVLSMGMSGSYRVAIDEGATMVRLGTVLFGPRS
jgi:hypothetical protein